ncbi:lysophospholipid acyltransferase family protein [Gordonia sp. ABSL1-1]|uniref:lysophospholipid acyltransferase family protein n=1 Tax=Gordonia sp. ABSL1-1 TaxID=3053923 RepID=UPI002572DA08|nr:lysophospholipid acyltransferase family protein [Gordonia sp. ABSL1-1]MDL9937381.1 lysophospholipid acyltransferase family protein [Gordonia sp. ABSL1-1]
MWYWAFKYVFLGPLLRVLGRPKIEGLENLPEEGAAILASNHLAVMDSFFLPLMVPRRIYFLAKSEYFTGTGLKGGFQRWFFTAVGQIPIDRSGAEAAEGALISARRQLSKGELMGMYPEGTRSPDGRLFKGKTGLARIALDTGVPVIPVAMINTDKFNPPGTIFPRPSKVVVRIGKPLNFARYEGMQGNRFIERSITDEIMYELMQLSGQQYVDIYAASLKDPKPAPEPPAATAA